MVRISTRVLDTMSDAAPTFGQHLAASLTAKLIVVLFLLIHSISIIFASSHSRFFILSKMMRTDALPRCQVNMSDPAEELPGAFANNRLYLQGARLTTSYDATTDVHVDLFGFAGDFLQPMYFIGKMITPCPKESFGLNETLLHFDDIQENVTLYCQLDCSWDRSHASEAITMTMVPTVSGDPNQARTSIIWRCNVTDYMDKHELMKNVQHLDIVPAVRVHFFMRYQQEPLIEVTTIDIPLDTGVAGLGGPQIRSNSTQAKSYFLQRPVPVGLCVSTYGDAVLDYVEEFVQHHLNVGFGSIVVGILGTKDSDRLRKAQQILHKYIENGVVVLAYNGLPGHWDCNIQVEKLQFYQSCLYYHKGITKYSATWDIDEFWIPPKELHVDGRHYHPHVKLGVGEVKPAKQVNESTIINASHWSTFHRFVQDDLLWQESEYAKSVSIGDTMMAIDRYYIENNCADSWCFHLFPSNMVHLKDTQAQRTKEIGRDFDRLEPKENNIWHKSIVNTKYAHMAGFHKAGSCLFESMNASLPVKSQMSLYHHFAAKRECHPSRFKAEVYGSMHHFYCLLKQRKSEDADKNWPVNSYVRSFASTVGRQLNRSVTIR